jgi:Fur family ferric uptake transcriptional regulator
VSDTSQDTRATRLREARAKLRSHLEGQGLRSTRQRDAVLEVFLDADAHVSVEDLYERLRGAHPSIGAATVYRCMGLFVQAGIAKERRFHEGRIRYEPGVGTGHHDHLVCLSCGDIQEFENPTIERLQEEIAGSRGFSVTYHRLELYGLCPRCRAKASGLSRGDEAGSPRF